MPSAALPPQHAPSLVRGLGLTAATAIVIAEVIGTGVFLKARVMTCNVEWPWAVIVVWIVAGLLAMAGVLTYGELSAMMPRAGGEYVFIREAYGKLAGFLFGWMRCFIGNTGGMAALAFGLGIFLNVLFGGALAGAGFSVPLGSTSLRVERHPVDCRRRLVDRLCHQLRGDLRQRPHRLPARGPEDSLFVLGIGTLAFFFGRGDWGHFTMSGAAGLCEGVPAAARGGIAGAGAAMIAAMWAYNGWNEVTYIAGEVRDPGRNLPRALIGGLGIIAFLYVSVNVSYFFVLAPHDVASVALGSTVATDVVTRVLGPAGQQPAGRGLCDVRLQRARHGGAGLGARAICDGAGRPVLQGAGKGVAALEGADPLAGRADDLGGVAGDLRVVRHADRLRDVRDPGLRRDGDRVGVRVPAADA